MSDTLRRRPSPSGYATGPVVMALAACLGVTLGGCSSPPPGTPTVTSSPSRTTPAPDNTPRETPRTEGAGPSSPESRRAPRAPIMRGFAAVDGDTISRGPLEVRVIGVDTPEIGQCGYGEASAATRRFIRDGVSLQNRNGRDQYGRLLAYVVDARGRDLGTLLLRRGLANARYDSTDGYDWHPHQSRYRRLDGRVRHRCGRPTDGLGGPEPYRRPAGQPFPNCDAAASVGAAPLRRGDPGWNPELDGDGDGSACE